MSNSIIHETVLKDIVDLMNDTSDFLGDQKKAFGGKDYQFRSLTRNAKNLILVFPVISTKGISVETASMLTKAIEKHCVTLLQILFASVQITNTTGLQDYISKFHSNISVGDRISVDDFIDFTDSFSEAAMSGADFVKITDKEAFKYFQECRANFNTIVNTFIVNETALSDFNCYRDNLNNYNAVLEVKGSKRQRKKKMKNASKLNSSNSSDDSYDHAGAVYASLLGNDGYEADDDTQRDAMLSNISNTDNQWDDKKERYSTPTITNTKTYSKSNATRINQLDRDRKELVDKLSDNDIKKANELMPTKVMVDFYSKDKDGDVIRVERGLIGVKCKLYTVDSLEIIERVATKYADTNWVREIVRATTGEISFWRDFVFALDKAKIDAINSARRGSTAKMFKVLERRSVKNKISKWKANRADSAPITTLIINQDEVEYLKKDYNINMENRNIAIRLMESYNLMGLFIVNEPAEYVSFIWDEGNDASFETQSFRNLERESDDKNYRKVINLMTKISR